MFKRSFSVHILLPVLLLAGAVLCGAAVSFGAEEPEILKGTVQEVKPGFLFLKNVVFQDDTLPRKDIKVIWDKDTSFFHGLKKVPKEEVTPECRVLVKCSQVGPDRKAILVRIIGGKAQ